MDHEKTIIPVASGKGGVGKSLFTANLAIALAKLGHDTVAIDLDLGGSNLHTYLGLPNTNPGIGDFLKGKRTAFNKLLVPTRIRNLGFIPGDGKTPFWADIPFTQRMDLLEHLMAVPARYILLDLGAGTSFNTLNFFGLASKAAIITTFETPAIMNFLIFLRSFMFRIMASMVREYQEIFNALIDCFRQPVNSGPITVSSLVRRISAYDSQLAKRVTAKLATYRPRIFFNMGENPGELQITSKIRNTLLQSLGMEADFFGFIFYDDLVRQAAKKGETLLTTYPDSLTSRSIEHIARRVIKNWDHSFTDSASLLTADTEERYAAWYRRDHTSEITIS